MNLKKIKEKYAEIDKATKSFAIDAFDWFHVPQWIPRFTNIKVSRDPTDKDRFVVKLALEPPPQMIRFDFIFGDSPPKKNVWDSYKFYNRKNGK